MLENSMVIAKNWSVDIRWVFSYKYEKGIREIVRPKAFICLANSQTSSQDISLVM